MAEYARALLKILQKVKKLQIRISAYAKITNLNIDIKTPGSVTLRKPSIKN